MKWFTLSVTRGIHSVAVDDRTETHFIKIFIVLFSATEDMALCVCFLFTFIALVLNWGGLHFGTFIDSPRAQ